MSRGDCVEMETLFPSGPPASRVKSPDHPSAARKFESATNLPIAQQFQRRPITELLGRGQKKMHDRPMVRIGQLSQTFADPRHQGMFSKLPHWISKSLGPVSPSNDLSFGRPHLKHINGDAKSLSHIHLIQRSAFCLF